MAKALFLMIVLIKLVHTTFAISIEDNTINPPDKKGRFISFNNEEGEIKIELDFTVPFMKIPITNRKNGQLEHPTLDVNTRGLVSVGAMIFLFVTLVPKIVQLFVPQAQSSAMEGMMPLMGRVEEALQSMDVSSTECYQRAACWVAGKTLMNYTFPNARNSQWIGYVIENDAVQEAFNKGMGGEDCSDYKCPLSMNVIAQMFKAGRQLLV